MARTVNLYEAKTEWSRLVDEAAAGAELVIAKSGIPLADGRYALEDLWA